MRPAISAERAHPWLLASGSLRRVCRPRSGSALSSQLDFGVGRREHRPQTGDTPMNKVTPFLMFNDQLEAAIDFYTTTFPSSEVRNEPTTRRSRARPVRSPGVP